MPFALVPLGYASGSGAARICQRGAKATERGEGVVPPPTVGRIFMKIRV